MSSADAALKIKRALLTVSDKTDLLPLARALVRSGTEIVATGKTAELLKQDGIKVVPIEEISGSPEAFQGRMKTLSFPVCSGILYRRGDSSDEADLKQLSILPIDCIVVNFYPFEETLKKFSQDEIHQKNKILIEQIDIGGPTLVRAAAKNTPFVLTLTSPTQYQKVIKELDQSQTVSAETVYQYATEAWSMVQAYDQAIDVALGSQSKLKYGENPHQKGFLKINSDSPIEWSSPVLGDALSYNNILDLSAAYLIAQQLKEKFPDHQVAVIVKHNNPCGVSLFPRSTPQKEVLEYAWESDPVSAFGSVIVLSEKLEVSTAQILSDRFIEVIAAPCLQDSKEALQILSQKRKKLRAINLLNFKTETSYQKISVVGGELFQEKDFKKKEVFSSVTKEEFSQSLNQLAEFGVTVCQHLKSNAVALVREISENSQKGFQLVGAGQGQPNRIDSLKALAIPRAQKVLKKMDLTNVLLVSDAFFPFRDTVDAAAEVGIQWIVQPGGSIKDKDSIDACNDKNIAMAFTGIRHFKH